MKKFILARQSDGFIRMIGDSPDASGIPAIEGFTIIEVDNNPPGDLDEYKWNWTNGSYEKMPKRPSPRHEFENGEWVDKNPPSPQAPISAEAARRQMYPSVENQLDMLWHAMNDGQLPKIEPFYTSIKLVKDANPKPSTEKVWPVEKRV